jgi:hypothetical protein
MLAQAALPLIIFFTLLSTTQASACDLRLVGSSELNLRLEPKRGASVISTLSINSRVCIEKSEIERPEKWSYISTELDRDLKGWVLTKYLASEVTRENKASEEAEKSLAKKDYANAVKWAERAAEASETPENVKLLIKTYKAAGEEKRLRRAEERLASLQLSITNMGEGTEKISIATTPTRESSPITQDLWKKLFCDNQATAKKRLTEPFEAIRLDGLQGAELLFPKSSHLADEIRTLYKISDLVVNDDIDECLLKSEPDEDRCDGFLDLYAEVRKNAQRNLVHKSTAKIKEMFLAIDKFKSKTGWWKNTKREITLGLTPAFDELLEDAKGVRSPNHQINSASEWDRFWLQQNYFSPKASTSLVYADNLKFTICNYFDLTFSNRLSTDHILGLDGLQRLAEHLISKAQPESAKELLQIIINEYPKTGWVEGNGHFGGSYASQAEKTLVKLNCKDEGKKSPHFKSVKNFLKTLKSTLKNPNTSQWASLFTCHVVLIESKKNSFTEQSTQLQTVNFINDNKDEILKVIPSIDEKRRELAFPHIQFYLDPTGKLVRISK